MRKTTLSRNVAKEGDRVSREPQIIQLFEDHRGRTTLVVGVALTAVIKAASSL